MRAGDTDASGEVVQRVVKRFAWIAVSPVVFAACGSSAQPPTVPKSKPQQQFAPSRVAPADVDAFVAECRAHIEAAKLKHAAIASASAVRTLANTLEPLDEALRALGAAAGMGRLAYETHPDEHMRDAGRLCEREMSEEHGELFRDEQVFKALGAVDLSALDPLAKRFVVDSQRRYAREGMSLDTAMRQPLVWIDKQITEHGQEIHSEIARDTRSFTVGDRKRLAGMPADWLDKHVPDSDGEIRITTDPPDALPILTYADDDDLRKKLYIAYRSRGDRSNESTLRDLLGTRHHKATILSFNDWADYASDDKMLRGGKAIGEFLDRVYALAKPHADREYRDLLALLKKRDPTATAVGDWQKLWLEAKLKQERFAVDPAVVRTYLPHDRVLAGLLELTGSLFELEYRRADVAVWHADVLAFDVMRGATKLGRIFLDLHPRADKYKHAAMFPIRDGGNGTLPEAALVGNFTRGQVEHAEVVTLFHEFGHVLHHVLGGHQRWISQSGIAIERDFSEAPAMLFEEWAWSFDVLVRFAAHHESGAPIPRALVERMQRARRFGTGLWTSQQVFYAAISLRFHQQQPSDLLKLVKELQAKYTPFAHVAGTHIHTSFGHLVDQSALYYSYLWSLVIAKDLLTPFANNLLDPTTVRRYRDRVLVPGGTKNATDLVADFLGRPYTFAAFERFLTGN